MGARPPQGICGGCASHETVMGRVDGSCCCGLGVSAAASTAAEEACGRDDSNSTGREPARAGDAERGGERLLVLSYILHELLADGPDGLRQRGAEHHHLLLVRRVQQNLLHVLAHLCATGGGKKQTNKKRREEVEFFLLI